MSASNSIATITNSIEIESELAFKAPATMSEEDFYKILGVKFDATPDEVRHAYRKHARVSHPDVAPSQSQKEQDYFQKVSEAYAVLSDLQKRNAYNKAHGFPFVDFFDDENPETKNEAPNKGEPEAPGRIVSNLSGTKDLWKKLRKDKQGSDERVSDKVAQADPKTMEAESDEPPIAAWGEFDDQGSKGEKGKSVFSWLRRGKSDRNTEELRKYQDAILKANNIAPVDQETWQAEKENQSRRQRPVEEKPIAPGAGRIEERMFQFRVTSYESFLGTQRQIAFPSSGPDGFVRLNVKIPKGITDNTRMQISRGWDRISIKVEVIEDKFYRVSGSDVWVFAPVTLSEAAIGVAFSVLGPDASVQCSVGGKERFLAQERLAERGFSKESGKGDIIVQPYVVPSSLPAELSSELVAWGGKEVFESAKRARAGTPQIFGETGVIVVTVSPSELFQSSKVSFDAGGADSFEIPAGWTGGLLRSAQGREVVPYLLLPPNSGDMLQELSNRVKSVAVRSARDEMVG